MWVTKAGMEVAMQGGWHLSHLYSAPFPAVLAQKQDGALHAVTLSFCAQELAAAGRSRAGRGTN